MGCALERGHRVQTKVEMSAPGVGFEALGSEGACRAPEPSASRGRWHDASCVVDGIFLSRPGCQQPKGEAMRKPAVLLIIALLGATPISGQSVNFRIGAADANVRQADEYVGKVSVDDSSAPAGAVYLDFPRSGGLTTRIGALWIRKGLAHYVELPVLVLFGRDGVAPL